MTIGSGRIGRRPGRHPPRLLQLEELGALAVAERRLVLRQKVCQLQAELFGPVCHGSR